MNFIEIANAIFEKKYLYKNASEKDKEDAYYMINKKLSLCKKKNKQLNIISSFFNKKSKDINGNYILDRASALDLLYLYFKDVNKVPYEWYSKSKSKKTKVKKLPNVDIIMFMEYENLSEAEFDFLYENYQDDVEYKIKLLKRLKG